MNKLIKKNLTLLLAAVMLVSLMLSGCSSKGGDGKVNGGQQKAVKEELVVALPVDARAVDPHAASDSSSVTALNSVVETLVTYDEARNIVPLLAESWEQIDEKSFKFHLRKGVKFHNGEEMKASDVVFSFKRALSPTGARVQYIMGAIDGDGLEVVDDYTVIIRTKEPFGPLVSYLPYIGAAIISEKYYTENLDTAPSNPCGTGPMKFVEWKKGGYLKYVRNDDYWGEKTAYKEMTLRIIPENNSRMIELETGAVDIAFAISPNDFKRIQESSDMKLLTKPSTVVNRLVFNCQKPPFDNPKLRQAIDYAIDEKAIVQAVYRGAANYSPTLVTPEQLYFDKDNTEMYYDVEKAKALLKESGVKLPLKLALYTNDNQVRIDEATIVQTQLKEIGIDVEIKVFEYATYYDAIERGEADVAISGWGAVGFVDPDNNLYGPIHSSGIPSDNDCFYINPELDKLLEKQRALPNGPEREQTVKEALTLIRRETPYICIDNPLQAVGVRSYVKGFYATPAQDHPLAGVYFEQ